MGGVNTPSHLDFYDSEEASMTQIKGWRKVFTVLAFIGPTLIGILIFSIYPIIFNFYISFTNRNQYHPNPDCSVGLTGILEPTCWSIFREHAPQGLGTPYRIASPLISNYETLLGKLFTYPVLTGLLEILICFLPLIIAIQINKQFSKHESRPIPAWVLTGSGVLLGIVLWIVLNGDAAISKIMLAGEFFTTNIHTILYVLVCIPLFYAVGLGLALLLNVPDLPGRTFFRVILIVPWAASTVAIMMSLVWKFFFQETGTINQVLGLFHFQKTLFLSNPIWAFVVIVIANVWYSYPFFMVTILGALQSIPAEIYEAAEVDGATYWQRLFTITMPLLRPAVVPIIVLSSITTYQMFGTVWAITGGGPSRGAGVPGATDMVMTFAYKQVFQLNAYGKMGAFAVITFMMLFIATLYSLRISRITKGAYE